MKAVTMLETIRSLLGTPACAIPLSSCRILRPHLLTRAGLPTEGTAILFSIPYLVTSDEALPGRNLSLYAVPRDYHGYTKILSDSLLPRLRELYPTKRFALFADHSPIAEVDAAARAGLGVIGRHGLLITPDFGSFVFLGELITDAEYAEVTGCPDQIIPPTPPRCEDCGACVSACPTGTLPGHERDACLSSLTQKKGELTPDERKALLRGGLAWGCDACQLACPHNKAVLRERRDTPLPYFTSQRLSQLSVSTLDAMTDDEFSERAYAWRGRAVIRRNLELLESSEENPNERSRS